MHELSLVQSILEIVDEYKIRQGFNRVISISLCFGKGSTVVPAALEFAFEILSKESIAQGAKLIFDIKPLVIYCIACDKDFIVNSYEAICPECSGTEVMLSGGTEELKLVEMEVE